MPFSSSLSYLILCFMSLYYKGFLSHLLKRENALGVVFELQAPPACNFLKTRGLLSFVENSLSGLLRDRVQGKDRFSSFPTILSPTPWGDYLSINKNKTVIGARIMFCHLPVTQASALHRENVCPSFIYLLNKFSLSIHPM